MVIAVDKLELARKGLQGLKGAPPSARLSRRAALKQLSDELVRLKAAGFSHAALATECSRLLGCDVSPSAIKDALYRGKRTGSSGTRSRRARKPDARATQAAPSASAEVTPPSQALPPPSPSAERASEEAVVVVGRGRGGFEVRPDQEDI